jgi:hypothetical protein
VVALLGEYIGNGLPARLVDESTVNEHDIVSGALGQVCRSGGGMKDRSGHENDGG